MSTYLRAAMASLVLMLFSRVLGLVRESMLAASFGTTAMADVVVVMITLPDIVANVLATGALGLVLVPWWARQLPAAQAASQKRVALALSGVGAALALGLLLWPAPLAHLLAPGVSESHQAALLAGVRWSALALPLSFTAAVWYTRLQHERDVVGMYGMNVAHTSVVIPVLAGVAFFYSGAHVVGWLGLGLLAAVGLRLGWLHWRMSRLAHAARTPQAPVEGLPAWRIWCWAGLATGLPVALPVVARSLVSSGGDGALATFNYAWKLVELPNLLAIQLVTALAFPALARAHAEGRGIAVQLRSAFVLSWTLACAAALGLALGAQPVADLLFGWGRMESRHVDEVARWSAWGAWTLLPQALVAVLVSLLATLGRMRAAALGYALGLTALLLYGAQGPREVMFALVLAFAVAAVVMLFAARREVAAALAWREMALPAGLCAALWAGLRGVSLDNPWLTLVGAGLAAGLLMGLCVLASPVLRSLLRR
ncbi:MAG: lipid II flippase MurJ [Burkholderiaceae bacterium]|nr:lipid II flippase MurJ [Burkholderiaceae bacterium]MDO9090704.1 lipid II flippase MurJ [Burkholderiaceae bacterium]